MTDNLIDSLPKKFRINYNDCKYIGGMSFLYSVFRGGLAKVLKKEDDLDFVVRLTIHQEKIARKLNEKGYDVPKIFGGFKIYHEDKCSFVPGFVNEDMHSLKKLNNIPGLYYDYFLNLHKDILDNLLRGGFVPGDVKRENSLCDLKLKKIYLLDYDDWDYIGEDEKIITPRHEIFKKLK